MDAPHPPMRRPSRTSSNFGPNHNAPAVITPTTHHRLPLLQDHPGLFIHLRSFEFFGGLVAAYENRIGFFGHGNCVLVGRLKQEEQGSAKEENVRCPLTGAGISTSLEVESNLELFNTIWP